MQFPFLFERKETGVRPVSPFLIAEDHVKREEGDTGLTPVSSVSVSIQSNFSDVKLESPVQTARM